MRNLHVLFKVFSLFVFCSVNVYSAGINSLLIKTVDENNQPINADIVKWWFSDELGDKKTLECKKQGNCSEWLIQDTKSQAINIYALASIVKKDDPLCWDWFEAEAKSHADQKELKITLSYSTTVCK
jgi:hypothetical protein